MRALTDLKSVVETLRTSQFYIEYSKIFYDGEKIGEGRSSDYYNFLGGEIWEKG